MESDDGDPTDSGKLVSPERLSAESVRALYEVHGRDLLTFLIGVLRDRDAAWDVSQITFQRLLEVGHLARHETVRGWLFKVAFHEAMAFRRKQSRSERIQREIAVGLSEDQVDFQSAMQSLVREEEVARLRALMQQPPDEQQFVVRQRIQEEKTFAVIAEELQVPLGTVLTRMRLAIQKLQKWFGREDIG